MDEVDGSVVETRHRVSSNEANESSAKLSKGGPKSSAPVIDEKSSTEFPFRSVNLSNKERLLLRKQALQMKKRPVLAVGNLMSYCFKFFKWKSDPILLLDKFIIVIPAG